MTDETEHLADMVIIPLAFFAVKDNEMILSLVEDSLNER